MPDWAIGALATVAAGLVGSWVSIVMWAIPSGRWRPIRLRAAVHRIGVAPLGGHARDLPTIGDTTGNTRAIRIWMCNRSNVPQEVEVVWQRGHVLWPLLTRAQLAPRTIPLDRKQDGDVVLKFLPTTGWRRLDDTPPGRQAFIWLVVRGRLGKTTRRMVRAHLYGPGSILW